MPQDTDDLTKVREAIQKGDLKAVVRALEERRRTIDPGFSTLQTRKETPEILESEKLSNAIRVAKNAEHIVSTLKTNDKYIEAAQVKQEFITNILKPLQKDLENPKKDIDVKQYNNTMRDISIRNHVPETIISNTLGQKSLFDTVIDTIKNTVKNVMNLFKGDQSEISHTANAYASAHLDQQRPSAAQQMPNIDLKTIKGLTAAAQNNNNQIDLSNTPNKSASGRIK